MKKLYLTIFIIQLFLAIYIVNFERVKQTKPIEIKDKYEPKLIPLYEKSDTVVKLINI